jgi:UDP-glucose 4-epimerase
MANRALVTGGAGFVGSWLARELLQRGWVVTIVDDLSNGKEEQAPPGAKFVLGDLAAPDTYPALSGAPYDVIYHVAAQASNAISFKKPLLDLSSNQIATLRLLDFARDTGVSRFIFTSSMSAYGDAQTFPTPESEPLRPRSPYAVHKAACEHYLGLFAEEHGLQPTVFRLYTTYGGGQNLDNVDQGLLSIYLAYLVRGEPILVKGSLDRKRDVVHVSDVIGALVAAADHPQTIGKTYNLCSGTSLTIRELIRGLVTEARLDPDEYPIIVEGATPGDPLKTHGSFAAAQADFGYQPAIMPSDGIRLTVEAARRQGYFD